MATEADLAALLAIVKATKSSSASVPVSAEPEYLPEVDTSPPTTIRPYGRNCLGHSIIVPAIPGYSSETCWRICGWHGTPTAWQPAGESCNECERTIIDKKEPLQVEQIEPRKAAMVFDPQTKVWILVEVCEP